MLTDREIVAAMQEANPLPEPELLPDDPAGFDILLDKISERRVPMLSTPETRAEQLEAVPAPTTWKRRPLAVLASFIAILVAVGISALIFRGGGSDSASPTTAPTTPSSLAPSSTLPPTTAPPDAAPSTIDPLPAFAPGVFVTYGAEQGVADGCGYSIGLAGGDVYLAGECGLLHFDGSGFQFVTEIPYVGLQTLAVTPDGSVWMGNSDTDVVQWTGRELIEHDMRSPWIEATGDGTVWARQYPRLDEWGDEEFVRNMLMRFDGSQWSHEPEPGAVVGLDVALDGTLWVTERSERELNEGVITAYYVLKSYAGSSWTTQQTPDGFSGIVGFAADGAIIVSLDHRVEGDFAAFHGEEWTTYEMPTLEELEIPVRIDSFETFESLDMYGPTITEDGTLWAYSKSSYGVFSFDGDEWTRYTTEDGLASSRITFLEVGPDGSLWFGTEDAGVTRYLPEQ